MSTADTAGPASGLLTLLSNFLKRPEGLNTRLIILTVFLATLPVSSIALFALHVVAIRRRGGERLYLFKMVKREGGAYIVGSRAPLLCILGLVVFATLGSTALGAYRLFNDFSYGILHLNVSISTFVSSPRF